MVKYKLQRTKPTIPDFLFVAGGLIVVIAYLYIVSLDAFILLCGIAILIGLVYRLSEYFTKSYPTEIETGEEGLTITYDRGLKRIITYKYIKAAMAFPHFNTPFDRLIVYLNSTEPLKNDKGTNFSRTIVMDHDSALKVVQEIKNRLPSPKPAIPLETKEDNKLKKVSK